MIRKTLLLFAVLFAGINLQAANTPADNPVADPRAVVVNGNARFTVLTPEMIRIEYSEKGIFEDRASFVVLNRRLPVPKFTVREKDGMLMISTDKLTLRYKVGSSLGTRENPSSENLTITFPLNGDKVVWYPWKKDSLNLKGTMRTLDRVNGDGRDMLEDGLVSRSGWAVIDEQLPRRDGSMSFMFGESADGMPWAERRRDEGAEDLYFMGYGHDYKRALGDFVKIAGRIPMPPMYAFGYWYSKYQKYTQQDFMDIVADVEQNKVPLDVMVIDMDWHLKGWTGWSWNRELIPDPAGLIGFMHDHNLKTTLNLHPADGVKTHEDNHQQLARDLGLPLDKDIPWNIENKQFYQSFFKNIIRPHESIGVDFWWLDWQQWLHAKNFDKLGNTFWINHVFYTDKKLTGKGRPMIFHRWGGLGNHRYQIGFSGDAHTNYPSLAFQPYFTATASNVGYGYWSHDIGGHIQPDENDPQLYLRWIQYGVFSPILRTHSAMFPNIERRIWKYPNFDLMKQAVELRYALAPYIYTQARTAYDTGVSICRPLYYEWPEEEQSYTSENEYLFGGDILVAPVVAPADPATGISTREVWLPEGQWYDVAHNKMLDGDRTVSLQYTQNEIPYFYRAGAVIPLYPPLTNLKQRPDKLILQFVPGRDGESMYYEDENDNDNYQNGECTFTRITQQHRGKKGTYTIHPAQGSFKGMPAARSYEIELLGREVRPKSVSVNGKLCTEAENESARLLLSLREEYPKPMKKTLDTSYSWSYDYATGKILIRIPSSPTNQKISIQVN